MANPTDRQLLTIDQVAVQLQLSVRTLRDWRVKGKGPPARTLGEGVQPRIRYRQSDVDAWLEGSKQ